GAAAEGQGRAHSRGCRLGESERLNKVKAGVSTSVPAFVPAEGDQAADFMPGAATAALQRVHPAFRRGIVGAQ
ncbi:MAG: hypothetical protein NTU78_00420, partial [Alphaproteobacteria bacterium]|nr:hypothetical protein [Alphaproteobacteria bacterium]